MIELINLKAGDIIQTKIAYIFGKCIDITDQIELIDTNERSSYWQVKNCFFKAFVKLVDGKNMIKLKTDNCTLEISVFYEKAVENDHHVRVLYVICNDDDGNFQSPDLTSNNYKSAIKRISLNVNLLQTFISELIYKESGVHKTFRFYKDDDNNVCECYKTRLSLKQALNMNSKELFIYLANEIASNSELFNQNCKYIAVLSFTRFEPSTQHLNDVFANTKGFCALGAEWLAVYGTGSFYTWPERLEDVQKHFLNDTLIDEKNFMNDTAFRNTYWAAYSTSLGSLLHEFSHILDLGHNESGIMARGFDDLFAFFTINFNNCFCYEKFKKSISNNKIIERVMMRECDVKDGQKLFRKETTYALFKNSQDRKLEIISNLIWNKSKLDYITWSQFDFKPPERQACKCLLNLFYEKCNLNILLNHRWLNNSHVNHNQENAFSMNLNDSIASIYSSNGIVLYELRDNCARTIDFNYMCNNNSNEHLTHNIKIDIQKYKYLITSLEIFLLDCLGNTQKYKFY